MAGLHYSVSGLTGSLFFLLFLFFDDSENSKKSSYTSPIETTTNNLKTTHSIPKLLKDFNYIYLLVSYGILVGAYYTFSVLLPGYFSEKYLEFSGRLGFVMIISGLVGSVVCGYVLDFVRGESPENDKIKSPYKKVTVLFYFFATIFFIWFFVQVKNYDDNSSEFVTYLLIISLGFMACGYIPVGFEFAAEITFPVAESTSAGFLDLGAQVFGWFLTKSCIYLNEKSDILSKGCLCGVVGIGLVITLFITDKSKRRDAHNVNMPILPKL